MYLMSFFRSYVNYMSQPIRKTEQLSIFEELTDKELSNILIQINNDIGISRLSRPIKLLVSAEMKYSNLDNHQCRHQIFLHIAAPSETKCVHIQKGFNPQELHAKLVEKLTSLV